MDDDKNIYKVNKRYKLCLILRRGGGLMHWVDQICKDNGWSINELSRKSGVPVGTLGNAKARKTPIDRLGYSTIIKLAKVCNLFPESLITLYDGYIE